MTLTTALAIALFVVLVLSAAFRAASWAFDC